MTHLERFRVLEPFYRRVPVPLFYRDLAALAAGFVTHVLTTNVDTLLEQALGAVGLTVGRDYCVDVCVRPTIGDRADHDRQALRRPRPGAAADGP